MKTNILTAVLLAAAIGVCSGYAQTVASSASFPLPGRSATDAPYEFRTDKSDGGINVSFTLNNIERVIIDSVTDKSRISVPGLSSTTFAGLPAYSNTYTPLVAIGPEANQRTLYLSDMPNGMLIITLLIDGEASSTYKLIKN